jgi:hypothetical protein
MFQEREEKERTFKEDFQEREEKRKKKIGKKQIPILWNQFRGLGFLSCRRNYS